MAGGKERGGALSSEPPLRLRAFFLDDSLLPPSESLRCTLAAPTSAALSRRERGKEGGDRCWGWGDEECRRRA